MNTRCLSLGLNHSYFACRKTFGQELCVSSDRLSASFPSCEKKYPPQRDKAKLWWNCATKIWPHFACTLRSLRGKQNLLHSRNAYRTMQFAVRLSLPATKSSKEFMFGMGKNLKMISYVCRWGQKGKNRNHKIGKLFERHCGIDASVAPMATKQICHLWGKDTLTHRYTIWVSAVCEIRSKC